jgi:tRNA 2-thiocytidine biosynthesis protein TtcA
MLARLSGKGQIDTVPPETRPMSDTLHPAPVTGDLPPEPKLCDDIHALFHGAPKTTEFRKLRKRLIRETREAIERYGMVNTAPDAPRAKWLVCLSGGKDSYTLLAVLTELQWRGLLPVDLLACNLDQGQPGFPATVLPEFLERMGVQHRIEYRDTYSVVVDKVPAGRTYCALCSRLRRANLYRVAREEGCTSVVLGHHRDDILETFFLNLFHGGKIATMPPKLLNDAGDLTVLRPLAHVAEADCEAFARAMNYPIIPCDLCGSQDGLQRQVVKRMLDDWETRMPGRRSKMFTALGQIRPSHMLDPALFDFASQEPEGIKSDVQTDDNSSEVPALR